jgi:flagellar hook protein FlgE
VAIQGDGFFEIGEGNPTGPASTMTASRYTRAGNFSVSTAGYLTTQGGQYVLGYALPAATPPTVAIQIPSGATGVAIDQSGGVSYVDPATNTRVTPFRIVMATFSNASGLQRAGDNMWQPSANSGTKSVNIPGVGGSGTLSPGAVEMSNVDLAQTFTNMITAERGFQANSRVITTADDMLQDLVNMKH